MKTIVVSNQDVVGSIPTFGASNYIMQKFNKQMTVEEAMKQHEDVGLVFSSYHLGGCVSCTLNSMETIEQVCAGYGVNADDLINSLDNLYVNAN